MRATDLRIVRLANYPFPVSEDEFAITIWEAARATSASPMYFDPVNIYRSGEQLLDGGLGANNPIREVVQAAQKIWPQGVVRDRIGCLVSIGTGNRDRAAKSTSMISAFNFIGTLVNLAIDTEAIADSFLQENRNMFVDNRYFRFTVARGLDSIALDETNELGSIKGHTRVYLESAVVDQQLSYAADQLARIQNKPTTLVSENRRTDPIEPPRRSSLTVSLAETSRGTREGTPLTHPSLSESSKVTGGTDDEYFKNFITTLANSFAIDPTLRALCAAALERIGDERFERNFGKLLIIFSQDLMKDLMRGEVGEGMGSIALAVSLSYVPRLPRFISNWSHTR
jgi:hypothetical protein